MIAFVSIVVLLSLKFFSQGGFHVFIGTDLTGSLDVHCQRLVDTAHKQCQRLIEQYQDIINAEEDSCLRSLEKARVDGWACVKSFNRSMQFQDASHRIAMKSWEDLHGIRNGSGLNLDIECDSECKKELSECMKTLQTQLLGCNKTLRVLHFQRWGRCFRRVVVIRNLQLQLNRTHSEHMSVRDELERCSRLLMRSWSSMQLTVFTLVVSVVSIAWLLRYWKTFVTPTLNDQPPDKVLGVRATMRDVQIQVVEGQRGLTDFATMEQSISDLERRLQVKESQLQQLGELEDTEILKASSEELQSQHRIQELNDIVRDSEQTNVLLQQEISTTRQQLQSVEQQVTDLREEQQHKDEEIRKLMWKLEKLQDNQAWEREEEEKKRHLSEEKYQQLMEHCQQIMREQQAELVQQEQQCLQEKAEKNWLLIEKQYEMSEMTFECSRKALALERALEKVASLEGHLARLEQSLTQDRHQLEKELVESELEEMKRRCSITSDERDEAEQRYRELNSRFDESISQKDLEILEANKKVSSLEAQKAALEKEHEKLKKWFQECTSRMVLEIFEAKAKVSSLEAEKEALEKQNEKLKQQFVESHKGCCKFRRVNVTFLDNEASHAHAENKNHIDLLLKLPGEREVHLSAPV